MLAATAAPFVMVAALAACGGSDGNSAGSTTSSTRAGATTSRAATATSVATTATTAAAVATTTATTAAATATTSAFRTEPTTGSLSKGMKGTRVAAMQTKLRALGYDVGPSDGLFGDKTDAAVKKFQTDQKLTVDGVAGAQTLGAIDRVCKEKTAC